MSLGEGDFEFACGRETTERIIFSMVRDKIADSLDDLDYNEQSILAGYAYRDFMYYLLCRFDLIRLNDEEAFKRLCRILLKRKGLVRKILDEWIEWWLIKWRQRVMIVFDNDDNKEQDADLGFVNEVLNRVQEDALNKLRKEVIAELVRQGEVCSVEAAANFVIKSVALELIDEKGYDAAVRELNNGALDVCSKALKRILEIKNSNQPIIILKVKVNSAR